jgi:translocation protein SEC62
MASPGGGPPLPGQQPTAAQIQAMQRQLAIDAEKNGMTVPAFIEFLKKKQQEQMAQQQAGQQQQQQPQPINPGPPNPAALAVANFLRNQDLKTRTCILNGQRKDMFKGEFSVCTEHVTLSASNS